MHATTETKKRREHNAFPKCSVCSSTPHGMQCGECVVFAIQNLRKQVEGESKNANTLREKLTNLLESKQAGPETLRMRHIRTQDRIKSLRDRISCLRDNIHEERIDAADLRFRILEKEQKLREAWYCLGHKRTELVEWVLDPLVCCLRDELESRLNDLAEARRENVLSAFRLFDLVLALDGCATIQSMQLPQHLHSFHRGAAMDSPHSAA